MTNYERAAYYGKFANHERNVKEASRSMGGVVNEIPTKKSTKKKQK